MAVTRRNGRWQTRYRDDTGSQHARTFDRKVDAQRCEVEELGKLGQGTWLDPRAGRTTFREFADEWLAMQPLRPTTSNTYSHLWPDSDDRTRAAVDDVLRTAADQVRTSEALRG